MLGFILGIILFILYHKIFRVYYFGNLGSSIFREFLIAQFFGYIISLIIGGIFGFALAGIGTILGLIIIVGVLYFVIRTIYLTIKENLRRKSDNLDYMTTSEQIQFLKKIWKFDKKVSNQDEA
ncbi:hypothetical protein [Miniphocaeibacter halophilus]|uniref:Uncharacterized protein n=1 Tax=Miniphocaeibacter halophilus TaxID=2931922 RepID=A0AC61MZZ4_9FIRM|nr:hypothetical protein [Miniphocaeibacter halophilus]QQK09015.1 hypothetical protein JFY71_05615 [Miniphocaeibacter halophilus]